MKKWNGVMVKMLLGLFMLVFVSVSNPQQALAFTLNVENPFSQTLWVAAVDFDDRYDSWRVHGWWNVTPNSTRTFEFPNSTSKQYVYVYGYAGNTVYDGRGSQSALNFTIIGDKFEYYLPDGACPAGKNRRTVTFMRLNIEEGFAYWMPASG